MHIINTAQPLKGVNGLGPTVMNTYRTEVYLNAGPEREDGKMQQACLLGLQYRQDFVDGVEPLTATLTLAARQELYTEL